MARQPRNSKAEYQRRLELGRQRGVSRQEARGHGTTPEHPERAARQPQRFERYISRLNQRRMASGKAPLEFEQPPYIGPGIRQGTESSLEEAERHTAGIPDPYRRIYVWSGGYTWQIEQGQRRRQKRAA